MDLIRVARLTQVQTSANDNRVEKRLGTIEALGMSTDDRERLKTLERENKELRRANEILKTASAFFAQAELDRKLK